MSEEKIIQEIKHLNKIINDCNQAYWEQSDGVVKPLVQHDSFLTKKRQQARDVFSAGDPNGAKKIHFEMIDYIEHPIPVFPKPVPILQLQGGGWFNWYKIFKDDVLAREYLIQAKLSSYSLHDSFSFLSDNHPNHKNLTYLTPFYWDGQNFHLDRKNPEFFELLKNAYKMHSEIDFDFMLQLWMRKDYISYPYRQNVNGVSDFWDDAAMPFHRLYAKWVMETCLEVNGNDYLPWIKIMNEVAHGGSGKKYHRIMYFHEMIWEEVLSDYTILPHVVVDKTGCEGTGAELKEPSLCSKQGACDRKAWLKVTKVGTEKVRFFDEEKDAHYNVNREKYPEVKVGDKVLLGRHGDNDYRRITGDSCVDEFHKYSTWEEYQLKKRPINFRRRRTEDGGGWKENGKYIIRNKYMADGEQSELLGRKLAQWHKDTGKFAVQCHFTHEVLHREPDGLWVPISTYERVKPTFERAKRFAKGYWEIIS